MDMTNLSDAVFTSLLIKGLTFGFEVSPFFAHLLHYYIEIWKKTAIYVLRSLKAHTGKDDGAHKQYINYISLPLFSLLSTFTLHTLTTRPMSIASHSFRSGSLRVHV